MDPEAYDAVKSNDHRRLAKRLRDQSGVDIHALNGAGLSMLHVACYQGHLDCARTLLETGKANAHMQGKTTKSTPLHLASLSGNPSLVKLLLQYQARTNVADASGKTALHYAAVGGHLEVISLLLGAGASTALTDNHDRNPYDYALEKEQHEAAKLLGHIKRTDQKEDEGADNTGEINLTFDRMDFRDGQHPSDVKKPPARPSVAAKRHADMLKKKADEIQARIDRANNKGAGGRGDNPPEGPPLQDNKDRAGRFKKEMGANNRAGGAPKPSKVGRKEQNKWVDPCSSSSDGGGDGDDASCSSPQEVKDFLEKELATVTGMETVKAMLRSLCRKMVVDQQRAKFGFVNQQNLNMLFLGNPGTGKTSMARVVAKLLKYMGILKKGHIVEVSRKDLVAEYSGQSAVKTMAKVEEATGGVLFVDEAYSLKHMESKDSFGQEVVDTLVAEMENRRDDMVVIMAGYTKEMTDFLRSNSGLQSRFPNVFDFPDYSYGEMAEIFRGMADGKKLKISEKITQERLTELISQSIPRSVASRGNARAVRNLVESVLTRQTDRVAEKGTVSMASLLTLQEEDFNLENAGGLGSPGGAGGSVLQTPGGQGGEVAAIMGKLDKIVGIQSVKDLFRSLRAKITISEERRKMGLPVDGASTMHMIFTGNPGTGKTTVARLMGELFRALRMLPGGNLVEVSRVDLVGEHVGETGPKTRRVVESAVGGVLFVDEAYALVSDGKDAFGREALETIMKCMEDMRDELIVILAGYPSNMDELLTRNPGLKSRFPINVPFPDYSSGELVEIAKGMLGEKQLSLSGDAAAVLSRMCKAQAASGDAMIGNARFVRNLLEAAGMRQAERLCALAERSREQLTTLEACDLQPK